MFSRRSALHFVPALAVAFLSVAPSYGSVLQNVQETFQSGGVFSGSLAFTDDFSNVTGVDGWLTGGAYGNDHINWIWNPTFNFATAFGSQYGQNFLMDGTPGLSYSNYITFTWDFSNAPNLVIATPAFLLSSYGGNNIGNADPLVSGSISSDSASSAVPEPATLGLLAGGLLGFSLLRRRKAIHSHS